MLKICEKKFDPFLRILYRDQSKYKMMKDPMKTFGRKVVPKMNLKNQKKSPAERGAIATVRTSELVALKKNIGGGPGPHGALGHPKNAASGSLLMEFWMPWK